MGAGKSIDAFCVKMANGRRSDAKSNGVSLADRRRPVYRQALYVCCRDRWLKRWGMFPLMAALVVALLAGCATPSAPASAVTPTVPAATPTSTPVPTPPPLTLAPAHTLTWTIRHFPAGLTSTPYFYDGPALAANDSNTAYICNVDGSTVEIWATHDRAATWQKVGAVKNSLGDAGCGAIVDETQPQRLIVSIYGPHSFQSGAPEAVDNYFSVNGGVTWTPLMSPSRKTPLFEELVSQGSVTYALVETPPQSMCECYEALYRSADAMRTWSRADTGLSVGNAGRFIMNLQIASSVELLATVKDNLTDGTQYGLWRSIDSGANWSPFGTSANGIVANQSVTSAGNQEPRFWRACGVSYTIGTREHPQTQQIKCTLNGGKTWLATGGADTSRYFVLMQATDGALLAFTPAPIENAATRTLVRISPGKQTWQSLGALPTDSAPSYAPGNGTGVLWLVKHPPNYGDPLTTVYTATYP